MPLIYHKIEHVDGIKAGASINLFLQEGLKSKARLRAEGRLPAAEDIYEQALKRREEWREERKIALADKPEILSFVLASDQERTWIGRHEGFYKPGFKGNREENVFFSYLETPPSDRDWVAISADDQETVHDASFRDEGGSADRWLSTGVTLKKFTDLKARGEDAPRSWLSRYNEVVRFDFVDPSQIESYAKLEKIVALPSSLNDEERKYLIDALQERLADFTQFDSPEKNILLHKHQGTLSIRVAFNAHKALNPEAQVAIKSVFDSFKTLDDIISKPSRVIGPIEKAGSCGLQSGPL